MELLNLRVLNITANKFIELKEYSLGLNFSRIINANPFKIKVPDAGVTHRGSK